MTMTLDVPVRRETLPRPATTTRPDETGHLALYGDLTCAWSYLASRRAAVLEAAGVEVDWWMVEHERPTPGRAPSPQARLEATRRDIERVSRRLLPGEELPHSLGRFVPLTKPAVSGYAEAYLAGVGREARRLLFEACWLRAVDVGNPRVVRALLADTVRHGQPSSDLLRDWGYSVDVTGEPVTSEAWRLVRQWRSDWSTGGAVVPVVVLGNGRRMSGVEAVEWLGAEVVRRGIAADLVDRAAQHSPPPKRDVVDLSWATQHGNRWLRARRDANAGELFERLRPWI